jgi:hypothetical protein
MENVRGKFVNNGDYYGMEEFIVGQPAETEYSVTDLKQVGIAEGDKVIGGYLDITGDGDDILVFIIKTEELTNMEVELENILDSTESLEEVEKWIVDNTKTHYIAYA